MVCKELLPIDIPIASSSVPGGVLINSFVVSAQVVCGVLWSCWETEQAEQVVLQFARFPSLPFVGLDGQKLRPELFLFGRCEQFREGIREVVADGGRREEPDEFFTGRFPASDHAVDAQSEIDEGHLFKCPEWHFRACAEFKRRDDVRAHFAVAEW